MNTNYLKYCILLLFTIYLVSCSQKHTDYLDYVDPMIGTDAHGHTFPGATVPFGMVQVSPSNDWKGWDWCSGYHYSDSILKGFAHTHVSGAGLSGLGDILLMPTVGKVILNSGNDKNVDNSYRSRFSHDNEEASAGYYSVLLKDYNILAELTCTRRVGFHKYTFNKEGTGNIIIDPTHNLLERNFSTGVEVLSDSEIQGYKHSDGEAGNRKVYFYAKFSKPFMEAGVSNNDSIIEDEKKFTGISAKAFTSFNIKKYESIEVKVALSFVSYEGAKKNYDAEADSLDFDSAHELAKAAWREKLSKIKVNHNNEEQLRIFYTGMYHSFISPNLISDVDGMYYVEGNTYRSDFDQYSNFSTWDTYRALHPLFTIIEQEKTADFVNSLVSRHTVSKVGLPVWELLGHDNVCMIGFSPISPMADAVLKEIKGIDPEETYQAIRAAAFSFKKNSPNYDVNGMKEYIRFGVVPGEIGCSVSKTTENNYYDFLIAEVAKKLGYKEDVELFRKRSYGYRHLYNPNNNYLWPKLSSGFWSIIDTTRWADLIKNYISGNIWGYSTYVPHDYGALINMHGGIEKYDKFLDKIFTDTSLIGGHMHVDISGFIGKYGHGDEPSHHMPYLYNYVGKPWKTQELVDQVMNEFYSDKPDGLINNEDFGQMSAWYIFSSLGFYPVCPGDFKYIIGSPSLKSAKIHLENGKTFTIKTKNRTKKNKYIQSVTLNGKPYSKNYILHQDIMNGGEIVFQMGEKPNKSWGNRLENLPVSFDNIDTTNLELDICYSPYDEDQTALFNDTREIKLVSKSTNSIIKYTLDGSIPNDKSVTYAKSLNITKSTLLNAISICGDLKSNVYTREYIKTINFNEGFPVMRLENKPVQYGKENGEQLFDHKVGTKIFSDGTWTGFKIKDMVLELELGEHYDIKEVVISALTNTGIWIFPPQAIEIYTKNDDGSFKLLGKKKIPVITKSTGPEINRYSLSFKKQSCNFLKIVVKNYEKLPFWHSGHGEHTWLFIDEIMVN